MKSILSKRKNIIAHQQATPSIWGFPSSSRASDATRIQLVYAVSPLVVAAVRAEGSADLMLPRFAAQAMQRWVSGLPALLPRWPALIDAAVIVEILIERMDASAATRVRFWSEMTGSLVGARGRNAKSDKRAAAAAGFATVARVSLQRLLDGEASSLAASGLESLTLTGIVSKRRVLPVGRLGLCRLPS